MTIAVLPTGHNDRVGSIIFHPRATLDLDTSAPCMVSCASDGSVLLWNLESDTPIANIEGHDSRVSRIAYHPSGRFLGTAWYVLKIPFRCNEALGHIT